MSGNLTIDIISCVLVLLGAFLSFTAGLGLLRFSDLLSRLHAQSKPQTMGLLLLLIGLALQQQQVGTVLFLVPIVIFQFVTTPAAGMVLARGGYRSRHYEDVPLHRDELIDEINRAQRAEELEAKRAARRLAPDAADQPEPVEHNPNAPTL